MNRHTRLEEIEIMRMENPISDSTLCNSLSEGDLAREMNRAQALGDDISPDLAPPLRSHVHRRRSLGLAAGVMAVTAVALAITFVGGYLGGGEGPDFATAAIEVAEENPRLLVTQPGWEVTRADQFEADQGEMTFSEGARERDGRLQITWYPVRFYNDYLEDRADVSPPTSGILLGHEATTVHYGRDEYATMLSPWGRVFVEIRGSVGSKDRYEEILRTIESVDIDTWLRALPPSTVQPNAREEAVEEMLRGVAVPPGFDALAIKAETSASDRYQLGVKVTGALACAWTQRWLAAKRTGDAAVAQEAVKAMATYREWPVIQQMIREEGAKAWPVNIEQAAKRLRDDAVDFGPATIETRADGASFEVGPQWSLALGCGPSYRRPLEP